VGSGQQPREAYLEFFVVDKDGPIIQNLFNYPNPFSSLTYFQFEHNRPGVSMDIDLSIYDLAGRLVKNISREDYVSDGYRVNDIDWDGLDNQRGEVIPGIYIYKLNIVFTNNGTQEVVESNAEKLVIIR
jgi:flagellar hook assembly protein FlgD